MALDQDRRPRWHSVAVPDGTPFTFTGFTRVVPLIVFGGVFALSILLAFTGPIDWYFGNGGVVLGFLLSSLAALTSGYLIATLRRSSNLTSEQRVLDPNLLIILGSTVFIALYPFVVHITTGKWFPDVITGLTNAGQAYANSKQLNVTNSPIALYAQMLIAPLTLPILPVTVFLWRRMNGKARALGTTCVALSLALNVSQGTANGVAEICAVVILFAGLLIASSAPQRQWRRVFTSAVAIIAVLAIFIGYYATIMESRLSADIEREQQKEQVAEKELRARMMASESLGAGTRRDSAFFAVVPESVQPVGFLLNNYLTQGYKGLSLAMEEPFTPSYGLGFSEFFRHNVLKLVGRSQDEKVVVSRTYAGKVTERGWPVDLLWASFFVHPASDIGFPGVVLLMVGIGLAFGLSWRDLVSRGDPLAATIFVMLGQLVFYLSANNQLFQGGESAIGFSVLFAAWLILRSVGRRGRSAALTS